MSTNSLPIVVVRWAARVLALATFLFWSWFYVGQVQEWIVQPVSQTPLMNVWAGQTLYLLFLAGLLIGFKWELAGGLLVTGAALTLFADTEPLFIPLATIPGVLYIACWFGGRRLSQKPVAYDGDSLAPSGLNAA
jgi:hypothetical protein